METSQEPTRECVPPPLEKETAKAEKSNFQLASDSITERLGLEKIESFSLHSLFSEVFKHHNPDDVENLLSVGTSASTPPLNASMGSLPTPWIFFRVLLGSLAAYMIFVLAWQEFANPNLLPGLIMIGSFAVPFSTLIFFFEINSPRNVSMIRVIQLLFIGGAMSLLLSLVLFEATPFLGAFGAPAAGIVEESGKLAAVLIGLRFIPLGRYPYRLNALLFGAAVGTGFAAFESAGYALVSGLEAGDTLMLETITLRGVLSPFSHIVWTAIATSAYWKCRKCHSDIWTTLSDSRFLLLFAAPVALHTVWNMDFTGPFLSKFAALGFVAWVIIISLIQTGIKEIRIAAEVGLESAEPKPAPKAKKATTQSRSK